MPKLEDIPSVIFLSGSSVTVLKKDDYYYAELAIKDGFIHFEFSEFSFAARTKDCVVKCWIEIAGGTQDAFEQRINILSASAKEGFVRQLKESFGKAVNWTLIFSNVCVQVSKFLEEQQVSHSYSDFTIKPESDILAPFLRDESTNIFFGMGESGKTLLALEMGLCVAFNLPFLGFKPSASGNILFVDYEASHREFFDRISLLASDKGLTPEDLDKRLFRFDPEGLPMRDIKNTIAHEIVSKQVKLLIVDSAILACGGEPESASIAGEFFNALKSLKVCVLLIAHKTKAEDSDKYPFGSIVFYNAPRNIWYVKKDMELGEDDIHIGLIHRKCNYARRQPPKALHITFNQGQIAIKEENNSRWGEDLGIKPRILNSLNEKAKTLTELSKDLAIHKDRLRPRLAELNKQSKVQKVGEIWEILYPKELIL